MTPVEELKDALATLEIIKGDAGLVVKGADPQEVYFRTDDDTDEDGNSYSTGVSVDMGDSDLPDGVVALYRAIPAMITILSGDVGLHGDFVEMGREESWLLAIQRAGDLDLARAINGGAR